MRTMVGCVALSLWLPVCLASGQESFDSCCLGVAQDKSFDSSCLGVAQDKKDGKPAADFATERAAFDAEFAKEALKVAGELVKARLVDGTGKEVACYLSTPEKPAAPRTYPSNLNSVALIPRKPLKGGQSTS